MSDQSDRAEATEDVAQALRVLGESWRGDWNEFDGRTLRSQLSELSEALRTGEFDIRLWAVRQDICLLCQSWTEYCVGH